MQFDFKAYSMDGKILKGRIEATHEKDAIDRLGTKNLLIVELVKYEAIKLPMTRRTGKVPLSNLASFTRQLATMLRAGLPMMSCLAGLERQVKHRALKSVLQTVVADVEHGLSLSEALHRHPRVFPALYTNMIAAGETSGALPEVLERLAGYLEASLHLRQKVRSAIAYPAIVSIMAILICIFLVTVIIPVFADIYKGFDHKLPGATLVLLHTSALVRAHLPALVIVTAATVLIVRAFLRTPQGTRLWDRAKLRFPIFGELAQKVILSRFSRTLATLTQSGVPILSSLQTVAKAADNVMFESAAKQMSQDIESGVTLVEAMGRHGLFPPMMCEMVAAGEQTGTVDEMLVQVADHYDREIEATLSGLTALIEPLLIMFLGIVVGSIVVAMFLPIFNITQIIKF